MRLKTPDSSTITIVLTALSKYCPELNEERLVRAIKSCPADVPQGKPAPEPDRGLKRSEVAQLLGCCDRTVDRMLDKGILSRITVGVRGVRISEREAMALLEGRN